MRDMYFTQKWRSLDEGMVVEWPCGTCGLYVHSLMKRKYLAFIPFVQMTSFGFVTKHFLLHKRARDLRIPSILLSLHFGNLFWRVVCSLTKINKNGWHVQQYSVIQYIKEQPMWQVWKESDMHICCMENSNAFWRLYWLMIKRFLTKFYRYIQAFEMFIGITN
jgi:hypothetical protein